jgi:deoxycytidylate deaminase
MYKKKHLDLAADLSYSSDKQEKIGAVITDKKKIVSWGVSLKKTHPIQGKYNKIRFADNKGEPGIDIAHVHAEIDALNRAKRKNLKGHTMYIYRESMTGDLRMCRPCKGCMQALIDRGIRKIVYTTPNGVAVEKITNFD